MNLRRLLGSASAREALDALPFAKLEAPTDHLVTVGSGALSSGGSGDITPRDGLVRYRKRRKAI
jgi:hypothetical protein